MLLVLVWLAKLDAGVELAGDPEVPAVLTEELAWELAWEPVAELATALEAELEGSPEPSPEETTPPWTLSGWLLLVVFPAAVIYAERVSPDDLFGNLVFLSNGLVLGISCCSEWK